MRAVEHVAGHTWHGRKGAVRHGFRYGVDYLLLDAEAEAPPAPRLFSRNGRGLMSLRDRDHGGTPGEGHGSQWVREVLDRRGIALTGKVLLLAQPRMLGHAFNPVSFWLCHDEAERLCLVIAEVTNTYGDRHSYLVHHDDLRPIRPEDELEARKLLHVSPFQPVEGGYRFRFDIGEDRIGIWIDYLRAEGGLTATLTGTRRPLTNGSILRACLRRPLGTRRVLALIHWQALRLWWKGARFRPRPEAPEQEVS